MMNLKHTRLLAFLLLFIILTSCDVFKKPATKPTVTTSEEIIQNPQVDPQGVFDENNIVLSFGALSDIHITGKLSDDSDDKLRSAILQLRMEASKHDNDGLDAIGIAGDIADTGTSEQVHTFTDILNSMDMKNVMLATGNHDKKTGAASMLGYLDVMGEEFFQNDVDKSMLNKGARHCVVNGYHFIFIEPSSYSKNCPYDERVINWLDQTLSKITTENPNAYVFLFTHPMPYNTCYGSTLEGGAWYTVHLDETLSKYPQVVTFSGHRHSPINNERSIMQTTYTALGCGSVRYIGLTQMISNHIISWVAGDEYNVSTGLLVQVDSNGNLRITRMFFSNYTTFKQPWELSYPANDSSHLKKYSMDRQDLNSAPVLKGEPVLEVSTSSDTGVISKALLKIPAATDDDQVNHYKVTIKNLSTGVISSHLFLSDFYRNANPCDMAKELSFPLNITEHGTYQIDITAIDAWDAESETISCKKTIGVATNELSADLPDVYTDFNFTNSTISDSNNKFSVDNKGAILSKVSLTFAGKTKTVDALTVNKKGQHATLRFLDYNASTMTNFYNSSTGFTIEALYVNYAPNGSQGIVCGTQNPGGWGLAESNGTPYFYTYVDSGNINISDSSSASKTELNHVVCTVIYNESQNQTVTSLYVNGKLVCSGYNYGKIGVHSSENLATAFCFGADIASNGTGTDLQMTNFALADVKIYDQALNFKQVDTAYQNALDSFNN